jgi:alpha-L-glutamate ligase-like protein
VRIVRELRSRGVLGINRRNADYTLRWNSRRLYKNVDDKLITKRLCEEAGIPTPKLIAVARHHFELHTLGEQMSRQTSFALKPASGAMGNGIVVVIGRDGDLFLRSGGRSIRESGLEHHASSILSGLYSLGGQPDAAMLEERLKVHPEMAAIASEGVPDVRVVVYRGVPVMAMTRLPTHRSGGRANLHQGAVGAGIDLVTGRIVGAMLENRMVRRHPDTGEMLIGREIPGIDATLRIAVAATDCTGLGYVGADVVVDADRGPMILELNARPGLAVQLANRAGLLPRLRAVDREIEHQGGFEERVELGRRIGEAERRI